MKTKVHQIKLLLSSLLISAAAYAQNIPVLKPGSVVLLDFSADYLHNFNTDKSLSNCEKVMHKLNAQKDYKLTAEDERILSYCDETKESPWEIIGYACSWYCLGGGDSVTASSQLASQGKNNYDPENAHDLDYQTAWVEGAAGNGAGEYLVYHFKGFTNPIDEIIVVNGYVKSQAAWENNARVKKLKVYVDNQPVAILELEDKRAEQGFKVKRIHPDKEEWTMRFEILEVYPGKKYEDAVITDIYFDGPSH